MLKHLINITYSTNGLNSLPIESVVSTPASATGSLAAPNIMPPINSSFGQSMTLSQAHHRTESPSPLKHPTVI